MAPLCRQAVRGENNVGNDALFVIGLQGSGDTVASFLQDWEVAKVALSCHLVPGIALSRKEIWLVWFLSGLASSFRQFCVVHTSCLVWNGQVFRSDLGVCK